MSHRFVPPPLPPSGPADVTVDRRLDSVSGGGRCAILGSMDNLLERSFPAAARLSRSDNRADGCTYFKFPPLRNP